MKLITVGDLRYEVLGHEIMLDMSRKVTAKYDQAYYDQFKERYYTDIGRKLHTWRRAFVECHAVDGKILDFGCGYGGLVVDDLTGNWYGFDIMPCVKERLGELRFDNVPTFSDYSTICMFDVFEHLVLPVHRLQLIAPGTQLVITIPCWEHWDDMDAIAEWKHYRPGEHLLYTSQQGFVAFMQSHGFEWVLSTNYESFIGRQDVVTFIFRKMTPAASQ